MTPGEQSGAYFIDHTAPGSKGPRLSLSAQQRFHNNPQRAVSNWIDTLPRR